VIPKIERVPIRNGGVTFEVRAAGRGSPIVFFHSFDGLGGWPDFLACLAERHTVYAPLHPLDSDGVESLDDVVDLALAYDELLTALGLRSAHLVGHFFGGMVAAELAALFPARAAKLVLISPMGLWLDAVPVADALSLPSQELAPLLWQDPDSLPARAWVAEPADEEARAAFQIAAVRLRADVGRFIWPIPDKGLKKRLHRISAPTLLLWGNVDRLNPVVYAEEFVRRVKPAALRLTNGGHMWVHEQPELAARTILEFLA
jgi:pimeloyl-ACP methyl ester carboxylesterase